LHDTDCLTKQGSHSGRKKLSIKSAAFQGHAPVELAPGPAFRLAEETAKLIRADAGLYLFIAIYTLSGLLFLRAYGAEEQVAYSIYLVYWTILFTMFFPLAAFAVDAAWIVHRFDEKRNLATKRMFSPRRLARLLSGICLLMAFMIFQGTFTSVKNGLSVWQDGFPFDKVQADIDAWLHFGVDPWRWLAFAQHDFVRIAVEWNYATVFFTICFGALFFVATSPLAARVRTRYLICFMLVWIVVGNVLAGLFMSAGPAFHGNVTGDELRFAAQLKFLARGADWPNSSAAYQNYLWTLHSAGQTGFGSGISAFPSVHVALAMFNALFVWEYSRRLGLLAFAYVALIQASSVYLGWHYAIDGYAAIIVTALIHAATRRMMPTGNARAVLTAS
jgi:hypothetical protein